MAIFHVNEVNKIRTELYRNALAQVNQVNWMLD